MFKALKRDRAFYGYLLRLTGPIALQNLITFSLGLIDTLMVSQLGNNEMAAVTAANVPVFLLISIVFGVQSGVGILISQYWGKGPAQHQPCHRRGGGAGRGSGAGHRAGAVPVAGADHGPDEQQASSVPAGRAVSAGHRLLLCVQYVSSIYVSAQRSVENASFGMKLFGMSTVLNTGMNYLLIFGKCGFPMLGVEGAAIATLLSRVAEFAVCLFCALRSRVIPLDLKALFRPGWEMLRRFVKYASPVMANELFWGLGNSLLTVILGHMTISVEFLAANAVMGNLNRLFLVVCFGLGAATAVMIGKAIGEGQSHDELMDLSRTLSWVTILVGAALAVIALALVPLLFQPVIFPLFKLYDLSAHLATTLAVTGFACIPFHAYSISAVTGILRAGGDVFWSTALDLAPQWLVALPLTALLALVLDADPWFVSLAIQAESFIKCPICLWRIRSRKWIHDVTLPEGER